MSGAPPILPAADLLLDQYIRLAQEIVDGASPQVRGSFLGGGDVCVFCVVCRHSRVEPWVGTKLESACLHSAQIGVLAHGARCKGAPSRAAAAPRRTHARAWRHERAQHTTP